MLLDRYFFSQCFCMLTHLYIWPLRRMSGRTTYWMYIDNINTLKQCNTCYKILLSCSYSLSLILTNVLKIYLNSYCCEILFIALLLVTNFDFMHPNIGQCAIQVEITNIGWTMYTYIGQYSIQVEITNTGWTMYPYIGQCSIQVEITNIGWTMHTYIGQCSIQVEITNIGWTMHPYIGQCSIQVEITNNGWTMYPYIGQCSIQVVVTNIGWTMYTYIGQCSILWGRDN